MVASGTGEGDTWLGVVEVGIVAVSTSARTVLFLFLGLSLV